MSLSKLKFKFQKKILITLLLFYTASYKKNYLFYLNVDVYKTFTNANSEACFFNFIKE